MTAPVSRGVFQCSSVPAPAFTKNQVQKAKNFYPLRLPGPATVMRNARNLRHWEPLGTDTLVNAAPDFKRLEPEPEP